jgi:glycosyltransferase involved in cell wall biosynthesis
MGKRCEKLAIIGGRASQINDKLVASASFGKIVEEFSKQYSHIYLSSPFKVLAALEEDYPLPANITMVPQPDWNTAIDSIKYIPKIRHSYKIAINHADHVFIRGNPVPATEFLYKYCARNRKPVCHWVVGNPMALLNSHKRDGFLKDTLGKLYIRFWEKRLLRGRHRVNGTLLCNGKELAERYKSSKTYAIVSTTLTKKDYYIREDTCGGQMITLLCLCYVRPEKGLEYLIEAIKDLKSRKKIMLLIAGSRERYLNYQNRLNEMVRSYELEEQIKFLGHVRYGKIHDLMLQSDIFVLPTLSEGTPRVIVEARAKCLPVVATNVGGIPTSVTNGYDGILVPPRDSKSLGSAIHHVVECGSFRRRLIRNGFETAKNLTIDRFVQRAVACFENQHHLKKKQLDQIAKTN